MSDKDEPLKYSNVPTLCDPIMYVLPSKSLTLTIKGGMVNMKKKCFIFKLVILRQLVE